MIKQTDSKYDFEEEISELESIYLIYIKDYKKAEKYVNYFENKIKNTKESCSSFESNITLATLLSRLGNYKGALSLLQVYEDKSKESCKQTVHRKLYLQNFKALMMIKTNKLNEAENILTKAIRMSEKSGMLSTPELACSYLYLSESEKRLKNSKKSKEYLSKVRQIQSELPNYGYEKNSWPIKDIKFYCWQHHGG